MITHSNCADEISNRIITAIAPAIGAHQDSIDVGGAYFHGIPCVTLRDTTEWVETVEGGFNRLTGMNAVKVREALANLSMPAERPQYYGDGHAADAIARAVVAEFGD